MFIDVAKKNIIFISEKTYPSTIERSKEEQKQTLGFTCNLFLIDRQADHGIYVANNLNI